jgi:TonB family protein
MACLDYNHFLYTSRPVRTLLLRIFFGNPLALTTTMVKSLSGPLLSLLLHGGVALGALYVATGVSGGGGGSSGESGQPFSVTLRAPSHDLVSVPPSRDSRAYGPVEGTDVIPDISITQEDTPFNLFAAEPSLLPKSARLHEGFPCATAEASRYTRLPVSSSEEGSESPLGIYTPKPTYPYRIECVVVAEFTIRADGGCDGIQVVESSGHPLFDAAVVTAVRTWTYRPTTRSSSQRLRFVFKLPR